MATILIADDDAQIRKLLRRTLESRGYEMIEAENGREAILLYQSQQPFRVITDIVMPEQECIETIIAFGFTGFAKKSFIPASQHRGIFSHIGAAHQSAPMAAQLAQHLGIKTNGLIPAP